MAAFNNSKSNSKLRGLYILIMVILMQVAVISGCSQNEPATDGTASSEPATLTDPHGPEYISVTLITGRPDREAVWTITNVKRISKYVTRDGRIVYGDGVLIEGECVAPAKGNIDEGDLNPFFNGSKEIMILEDIDGNKYEMQTDMADGSTTEDGKSLAKFKIQFSLAGAGQYNSKIKSWGDLIIADPLDENKVLPEHRVSLGTFDSKLT